MYSYPDFIGVFFYLTSKILQKFNILSDFPTVKKLNKNWRIFCCIRKILILLPFLKFSFDITLKLHIFTQVVLVIYYN